MGLKKEIVKLLLKTINLGYFRVGVPAIIINRSGKILLGKRDKSRLFFPLVWGLPGGSLEKKESIEDAVKREVKEEMGIEVSIIKYGKPLASSPKRDLPWQNLDTPVYCKIKKGTPKAKDETAEVKWFKPSEIRKMNLAYVCKEILEQEGLI